MAHEELKALYEIDKQHSDTPWEWWEFDSPPFSDWLSLDCRPSWSVNHIYRRKPDAPVWPVNNDAEDARKWRELEAYLPTSTNSQAVVEKISQLRSPELIQGYTAEQWQTIIDGEFLCEFSDIEGFEDKAHIQTLKKIDPFRSGLCLTWSYCRPLRIKGVRQPWFGGECPVDDDALVLARHLDDSSTWYKGTAKNVLWGSTLEFIEL